MSRGSGGRSGRGGGRSRERGSSGGKRPVRAARLLRWIWRLYPRRWQERFGDELEQHLRERLRRASTGAPGSRSAALVWDALRTLPRAWAAELGRGSPMTAWATELRSAWRAVTHAKRHAAFVVATLALALGFNAAVFSVSWAVLLEALPYEAPERLVRVEPPPVSLRAGSEWVVSEELGAMPGVERASVYIPDGGANFGDGGEATRLALAHVDEAFFALLGVEPALGRTPRGSDGALEAVLSHALWQEAFGGDPTVLGRRIELSGHAAVVVGVAPPGVDYPAGTDLWLSMPEVMDFFALAAGPSVLVRLTSPEALPALLEARRDELVRSFADKPAHVPRPEARLVPLRTELLGAVEGPLLALLGAAAAVLLLGCVNLAGIRVARLVRRCDELEVRRALGAGRARLFAQLSAESALLAAAAGVAALVVARLAGGALAAWLPAGTPGLAEVGVGTPVLLFTAAATLVSALLVGTLPAWRAARWSGRSGAGRTASPDRARTGVQGGLVVAQVALAIVLAAGAGLLGRSLARFAAVPLGYDTESVLTFRAHLPMQAYPDAEAQRIWVHRVEQGLATLPGVVQVGVGSRLPFASGMGLGAGLLPEGAEESARVSTALLRVSPGYFGALGIRLLAGTPPTPPAGGEGLGGVVLGRTAALRMFGEEDVVGRRVIVAGGSAEPATVVGVVEDVRLRGREGEAQPIAFASQEGAWISSPAFALRISGELDPVVEGVRRVLAEVDPKTPPDELRTTGQAAAEELAARRALARLAGLFGLAALALVGLGLHGMLTEWVQSRRRELGIRMALGAGAREVVRLTMARALALVTLGVALGLPAALASTRLLSGLLFGVSPSDPGVLGVVLALVMAVGAAAALAPALRAGRTDPVVPLRDS